MDLAYLIQLDPVYSALCCYLPTRDRINLQTLSSSIREIVLGSPNTWKRLDFSGRSRHVVLHYLMSEPVVQGAVEELVLDCTDIEANDVVEILVHCSNIKSLSLGGCMNLSAGAMDAVLSSRKQGFAKRLVHVGLLGAPLFKTTSVNIIASSVVRDFEALGIRTDLRPCRQEHAFTSRPDEQWHLCCENASTCYACGKSQKACSLCLSSRTCRGCFKFWCFDCESAISRVCYECGHSCPTCKEGVYVKCMECGSMFCKLHRGDDRVSLQSQSSIAGGRTQSIDPQLAIEAMQDTCDWCIQGKATAFRERFRC